MIPLPLTDRVTHLDPSTHPEKYLVDACASVFSFYSNEFDAVWLTDLKSGIRKAPVLDA